VVFHGDNGRPRGEDRSMTSTETNMITARAGALASCLLAVAAATAPAAQAMQVTHRFECTGAQQFLAAPAGIAAVGVTAVGAYGAPRPSAGVAGGRGAQVTGRVPLPAGLLYVNVGCPGKDTVGGFNGGASSPRGGGGGGASDIRTVATTPFKSGLTSRLLVAGGGGGGGGAKSTTATTMRGGLGGDAGRAGEGVAPTGAANGGGPGSATAGGWEGHGNGMVKWGFASAAGFRGTLGAGGLGGDNGPGDGFTGGGGGGGLYGGGGGGAGGLRDYTTVRYYGAGGGGGGSSLIGSGGTLALAPAGTQPSVTISYDIGGATPVGFAGVEDGILVVRPAPGINDILATRVTGPGGVPSYRIEERRVGQQLLAGNRCTNEATTSRVVCPIDAITRIRVLLGSGDDKANAGTIAIPVSQDGGQGADALRGGTSNDSLVGGPGADSFDGGSGNDTLSARDDTADASFGCGEGADTVIADATPNDPITAGQNGCERVEKG
jgi:hypothetical protein